MKNSEKLRIRTYVKNPNRVYESGNGISIEVLSNYADYIYERKELTEVFATSKIQLETPKATLLWGLTLNNAESKGCPVTIYMS